MENSVALGERHGTDVEVLPIVVDGPTGPVLHALVTAAVVTAAAPRTNWRREM